MTTSDMLVVGFDEPRLKRSFKRMTKLKRLEAENRELMARLQLAESKLKERNL